MKSISFLICLVFFELNQAQIWMVDPLEPIFPDSNDLIQYSNEWKADFPLGTSADVHVVLELTPNTEFSVTATMGAEKLDHSVWSHLIDVPVEQNTGLDSRTEQFINKKNPHVIRRAPFRIYEVIRPLKKDKFFTRNRFHALRLSIPASLISISGEFQVNIQIIGDAENYKGTFNFVVHPIELPKLSQSKFFYTNWFNLSRMEEKHDIKRWTKPWFSMLEKYASLMAHGRQNSITIPNELVQFEEGLISLDENKLIKFIDVFRKFGFQYYESPHLLYRGDEDDWG
ncbi:MAG: hypothetical protein R3250_14950, partial [Melioribacteraceae bacterium]|nr:hypothetical protein [Melioribacteraceae bacterium]